MLTEAEINEIMNAAARLEEKYPLLKQRGGLVESIHPLYSGEVERISVERFDQKGSLLGGFLLDPPPGDGVPPYTVGFDAGLAQLDLDDVARVTGRNVGSGLLQVFMREDTWTSYAELGGLSVRVIPRHVVDQMEQLEDSRFKPEVYEEDTQEQIEIDRLRKTYPEEAETKLYIHHYEQGLFGCDWLISSYYYDDYDSVPHEYLDSGEPLQIVRWKKVGYELPNPCVWSSDDFEIDSIYPSFSDDPDFKVIEKAIAEESIEPVVGLFSSDFGDPY